MKKLFVLDTNVLIHDPEAVFKFDDNDLYIPINVVEEVDNFKRESTERGRNCRHFCRILEGLRQSSDRHFAEGVPLGGPHGTLTIYVPKSHDPSRGLDHGAQDRAILKAAMEIRDAADGRPTVFVTMDTNLRIRADAVGMPAETYENSKTKTETESSVVEHEVDGEVIDNFFRSGRAPADGLPELRPNASVLLKDSNSRSHAAVARYDGERKEFVTLKTPKDGVMGIRPKNKEQAFALDLLLNDEIQLVTLIGKAGTGKTLLAIAAGLRKVTEEGVYTKMLVSRPVMPLGRDIGFLPGSVEEKLNPWMQPIFDNLEFVFGRKGERSYAEMMEDGTVQVEPLTYIRGRSLPNQYLIVDEAQNLTAHEIKTIITRAGEGSKIVLTGDPEQIDNPYIDASSNGLSVVAEKFRDQTVAGHVVLTKGERSQLAELAANLL